MNRRLPSCDQCTWFLVDDGEPLCEKIEEIPQPQSNWLMGKKYSRRPEICPLYLPKVMLA